MFKKLATVSCLTAGLMISSGEIVDAQQADGPVREGVRRTGQAIVEGTRAAARASGEAVRRTGQAAADVTRGAARATGEAARRTGQAARNAVEGTADAARRLTGRERSQDLEGKAQASVQNEATLQNSSEFEGRQPYQSGYRGVDQGEVQMSSQVIYSGRTYPLRHDSQGREFICVCGHPVYFDNSQSSDDQDRTQNNSDAPPAPEPYRADRPMSDGQSIDAGESSASSSSDQQDSTQTFAEDSQDAAGSSEKSGSDEN